MEWQFQGDGPDARCPEIEDRVFVWLDLEVIADDLVWVGQEWEAHDADDSYDGFEDNPEVEEERRVSVVAVDVVFTQFRDLDAKGYRGG